MTSRNKLFVNDIKLRLFFTKISLSKFQINEKNVICFITKIKFNTGLNV